MKMTALETLKRYFGYDSFRSGQETLIDGVLARKDVLGVMPTGAGKSVCFQIPALMMNGIAIIISPLCEKLKADGHNSSRYHAGLSDKERHDNQDDFLYRVWGK
ncbi:MAG: DEAD/DEAH box helicase [Fibromonadaceae bacterium]|jgi:ATP-dependent DNA helicase RecQ|nr:DEAD/DEAH box helicase [Fibromonadaceae bacterium]